MWREFLFYTPYELIQNQLTEDWLSKKRWQPSRRNYVMGGKIETAITLLFKSKIFYLNLFSSSKIWKNLPHKGREMWEKCVEFDKFANTSETSSSVRFRALLPNRYCVRLGISFKFTHFNQFWHNLLMFPLKNYHRILFLTNYKATNIQALNVSD